MKKNILLLFSIFVCISAFTQNTNITWQQCLGTDESDYPYCITYSQNSYLLSLVVGKGGEGITNYHGLGDAWLVNLDTLGNIIWEKCYGGSGSEKIIKIVTLPNNEYYLLGGTNSSDGDVQSNNHDSYDIWVVKIDSAKQIIWERCLGSYIHDSPKDITLTADGGVILLGHITSSGGDISEHFGGTDAWLCRLDADGNILWEKTYGGPSDDRLLKIISTSHDTYVLVGDFYTSEGLIDCQKDDSPMQKDVWLMEIDTLGNVIWQNCYGGSYWDAGRDVIEVDSGYVFVAVTNSNDIDVSGLNDESPGSLYGDIWVVKTDFEGTILWQKCLGGSKYDTPKTLYSLQDKGFIIFGLTDSDDGDVTGFHGSTGNAKDVWIVKIDSIGQLVWQKCFGSITYETLPMHGVAKKDDYTYALNVQSYGEEGDVECHISQPWGYDAWVFQIKDCQHYAPLQPQQPTGKDTLCVNTDSITTYATTPATNAWYYEWQLQPEEAGTTLNDSITTTVNWNPNYEGPAILKVRSLNDCGESAWSDSLVLQTYMCLGTEENPDQNTFRVYPNPTSSTLIIDIKDIKNAQNSKIEIYNTMRYKVFGIKATGNITSINVGDWAKGIYFVRVNIGNFVYSRKVVVD